MAKTVVDLVKGCGTCSELGAPGKSQRECKCPENKGKDNIQWAIANCIRKGLQHWKPKEESVAV